MRFDWDFSELYQFADKLGEVGRLETALKRATKDIAKALLKRMKSLTPVDEYDLISGWEGNHFLVKEVDGGFEVLIVNRDEKATWVNDGHRVRNRKDGPFYKVKRRIQVRKPHQWQKPVNDWYVFGHFFVERGILQLNNTVEIEEIIMRELEKWWEGCF